MAKLPLLLSACLVMTGCAAHYDISGALAGIPKEKRQPRVPGIVTVPAASLGGKHKVCYAVADSGPFDPWVWDTRSGWHVQTAEECYLKHPVPDARPLKGGNNHP